MKSIVIVLGEAFRHHGGIERYNREMCQALSEYALAHGLNLSIHAKNDETLSVDRRYVPEHAQVSFVGYKGNVFHLMYGVVKCVLQDRPDVVILNHVNFSPLGLVFRAMGVSFKYLVAIYGVEVWHRLPLFRRLGLRHADLVLSISEYSAQVGAQLNGVDLSRINTATDLRSSVAIYQRSGQICLA